MTTKDQETWLHYRDVQSDVLPVPPGTNISCSEDKLNQKRNAPKE